MANWSLTRMQYAAGLGILAALSPKLHPPLASLAGFAAAGLLTALRFRAVGLKTHRAFAPLVVAALGTAIQLLSGPHWTDATRFASQIQIAALVGQICISIAAGIRHGARDRTSPKQALARTFLEQRRRTRRLTVEVRGRMESVREETERLKALSSDFAARIAADPNQSAPDVVTLKARLAAQTERLRQRRSELEASTAAMRTESAALRDATEKWKNRNDPRPAEGC